MTGDYVSKNVLGDFEKRIVELLRRSKDFQLYLTEIAAKLGESLEAVRDAVNRLARRNQVRIVEEEPGDEDPLVILAEELREP